MLTFFLFLGFLLVANSAHPTLMGFAVVTLFINYKLHWRPYQPKSIFFGLLMFWLSVVVLVIYSDVYEIAFETLSISPNIVKTAYYAMTALLLYSIGIYLVTRRLANHEVFETEHIPYNGRRVVLVYLGSIILFTVINVSGRAIGLGELTKALGLLRQGLVFVMVYLFYKKSNQLFIPIALIGVEVILSFFSYFSTFKDVLIVFIVCFTYFKIELKLKQLLFLVTVGVGAFYLLLVWQAIKGEYRAFLSGGLRSQKVVVDRGEALGKFFELASTAKINDPDLWYASLDRLSYIEFFSEATDNVPETIPHTKGELWTNNVVHVLVPRLLYKNKKAIYDSEMVNTYATRKVAGADVGTSFSLGWLAESYIDFGYLFMFVPVLLVGLLVGAIYRYIYLNSYNHMWGCAFVAPLWVYISNNGTPGSKLLGWLLVYTITFYLVNRFVIKRLDAFLRAGHLPVAYTNVYPQTA